MGEKSQQAYFYTAKKKPAKIIFYNRKSQFLTQWSQMFLTEKRDILIFFQKP
jgi:hypothetical protein